MTLNPERRRQLLLARENISTQLEQLEGAAVDPYDGGITQGGMPDCRDVYADLQRELQEIDALLEGDGEDAEVEAKSAYQPMIKWYADGTVGNPVRPTTAGRILRVISVVFLVVVLGLGLFQAIGSFR